MSQLSLLRASLPSHVIPVVAPDSEIGSTLGIDDWHGKLYLNFGNCLFLEVLDMSLSRSKCIRQSGNEAGPTERQIWLYYSLYCLYFYSLVPCCTINKKLKLFL